MMGISAHAVTIKFGDFTAVDGVTMDVASGEFVTLLGPSGCGKTTLLKTISGFLTPTSGRVLLGDEDVTRVPPEARDTALCFQSYALFPHLTVRENLEFGLRQKRVGAAERRQRIADAADQLRLQGQMDKLPNQLSGGQQQRVALGRALVTRPKVILFDEPLSNLDAKLRDQVRLEIRRIQRDNELTAIYVTHDQAEALAMSDRIFVMNAGRVEQVDTPEVLYHRPRTQFVADFVGDANILTGDLDREISPGVWRVNTLIGAMTVACKSPPPSQTVTLCWRPENAQMGRDGLSGRVVHRAFQGHFTDLTLETDGTVYRVQTRHNFTPEGGEVRFIVAPQDVVILEDAA